MPATREKIAEVLNSEDFGTCEKWVVMWQFGLLGDFDSALIVAITKADEKNLERLNLGFPTQVSAYLSWSRGDMGKRLRDAGLDI